MSVAVAVATDTDPTPQLYLACPLTNVDGERRRAIKSEVTQVRQCIEQLTVGDRVAGEQWPLTIYAPIDKTAPWAKDGLSPLTVYERNYAAILDSDAVVVLADRSASAGIGQEIEWATRAGTPVLYLSSSNAVSRQIEGTPATITPVAYNNDSDTLSAHVTNFLRQQRSRILDGPRRRASRRLRLTPLTIQLQQRWNSCPDPTDLAARCLLNPTMIDLVLRDPARVAMLPVDTIALLCAELDVQLSPAVRQLSIRATRALILAAEADQWPEDTIERLRLHALAEIATNRDTDYDTLDSWRALLATMS